MVPGSFDHLLFPSLLDENLDLIFYLNYSICLISFLLNIDIKSLLIISKCSKVFFNASESFNFSSLSKICFDLSRLSIRFKLLLQMKNHRIQKHLLFLFQNFFVDFPFQQMFLLIYPQVLKFFLLVLSSFCLLLFIIMIRI